MLTTFDFQGRRRGTDSTGSKQIDGMRLPIVLFTAVITSIYYLRFLVSPAPGDTTSFELPSPAVGLLS
eukprot:scaffold2747_cov104-Cylindrotheca_fusiformis.AAC.6